MASAYLPLGSDGPAAAPDQRDLGIGDSTLGAKMARFQPAQVLTGGTQKVMKMFRECPEDGVALTRPLVRASSSLLCLADLTKMLQAENASTNPEIARGLHEVQLKATQEDREPTIQELVATGLPLDDISVAIYARVKNARHPNFMPHVKLGRDGGLDRVEGLWTSSRYFWCLVAFLGALANIVCLLNMNWYVLVSVEGVIFEHLSSHQYQGVNGFYSFFTDRWDVVDEGLKNHKFSSQQQQELELIVSDPERLHAILYLAVCVALIETLYLVTVLATAVFQVGYFLWHRRDPNERKEYFAHFHLMRFFEDSLPCLASLSALKLANFVHPSLIYNRYDDFMQERYVFGCQIARGTWRTVFLTVWFIVQSITSFGFAVVAFAVKALLVLSKLLSPLHSMAMSWFQVACLLNACVCVVTIDQQLQERVFRLIFGGQDSMFQDDEKALSNVYKSRVTREIVDTFYDKQGSLGKTLAMLAVMDHYSYQYLLVEDTSQEIDISHFSMNNNVVSEGQSSSHPHQT